MKTGYYDEYRIERAVDFLFEKLKSSNNPKPVGLHSIRVASLLWNHDENEDIVIAALLHDILEDTPATTEEVENEFGAAVTAIVDACTFDTQGDNYRDKLTIAKDSIDQAALIGSGALLVKAADFIDNANYYNKAGDLELRNYLHEKYSYFMQVSEANLSGTYIWKLLEEAYMTKVSSLAT